MEPNIDCLYLLRSHQSCQRNSRSGSKSKNNSKIEIKSKSENISRYSVFLGDL